MTREHTRPPSSQGDGDNATLKITATRLAIVDSRGQERLVLEVDDEMTRILLRSPDSPPDNTSGIEIFAMAAIDADPAATGVNFLRGGEIVASFEQVGADPTVYAS